MRYLRVDVNDTRVFDMITVGKHDGVVYDDDAKMVTIISPVLAETLVNTRLKIPVCFSSLYTLMPVSLAYSKKAFTTAFMSSFCMWQLSML